LSDEKTEVEATREIAEKLQQQNNKLLSLLYQWYMSRDFEEAAGWVTYEQTKEVLSRTGKI
jgi:hypothetical protein